jgi:hypothetical protein
MHVYRNRRYEEEIVMLKWHRGGEQRMAVKTLRVGIDYSRQIVQKLHGYVIYSPVSVVE